MSTAETHAAETHPAGVNLAGATGRLWGFTDEIDWVERQVRRAVAGKRATFTVTDRKVIGSRGIFHKRLISNYDYQVTAPTRREVRAICHLIADLVGQMS